MFDKKLIRKVEGKKVTIKCPFCPNGTTVEFSNRDDLQKWITGGGAPISIPVDYREVLISAICIPCQKGVFE